MKTPASLLLLLIPVFAMADEVVPINSVESFVNIRMLPNSASEIVGRLEQGKSATLVESVPDWHEIELDGGASGFISADWTRVIPDDEPDDVQASEAVAEESIEDTSGDESDNMEAAVIAEVPAEAPDPEVAAEAEPSPDVYPTTAVETPTVAAEATDGDAEDATTRETTPSPIASAPAPAQTMQSMKGAAGFLTKFVSPTEGGRSLIFDDGNNIGIGTTEPKQRLEVNGNIQIHEQNSSVAGLMITQAGGETGYIMHNRASTLTIGAGSVDRITISRDGNVGLGVSRPANPLDMASGAHVTSGGVWTNSSSREKKENITPLAAADALETLAGLQPVKFNYKNDGSEGYVGFIAEDVPELVATADRAGLSAMDIVAVLTKVVQEQQQRILELEARIDQR